MPFPDYFFSCDYDLIVKKAFMLTTSWKQDSNNCEHETQ